MIRDDHSLMAAINNSFSPAEQKRLAQIMAQRFTLTEDVGNTYSRTILRLVAKAYNCTIQNIYSVSRSFGAARATAALFLHERTMGGFSYNEVGHLLRPTQPMHHTSVMYLIERVVFDDRLERARMLIERELKKSTTEG